MSTEPQGVHSLFVWQTYLLTGYYYTATDEYDIKWTMPHCVLTLKLIGMMPAFDSHLFLTYYSSDFIYHYFYVGVNKWKMLKHRITH